MKKGKLIAVWSCKLRRSGTTTVALSLAFNINQLSNKKVLLANLSGKLSYLEKYIENDVKVTKTINDLEVYKDVVLEDKHVQTNVTKVNDRFSIIGSDKFGTNNPSSDFKQECLDKFLDNYDVVIVDLDTNVRDENEIYLERADIIIPVLLRDSVMLEDIMNDDDKILKYLYEDRSQIVINKEPLNESIVQNRKYEAFKSKFGLKNVYKVRYDQGIIESCCNDKECFTYLNKIKGSDNKFFTDMKALAIDLMVKFNIPFEDIELNENPIIKLIVKSFRL